MRHPVSRELLAYWDGLRGGRTAPERSDIDPAAIRSLLPFTFLLELDDRGGARARDAAFRLSGTRLNALFQRELKGCGFLDIWNPEDRAEAATLADGVLDGRVPAVAGLAGAPRDERPTDFELLLLPLRHHGRTHARLFGCLAAERVPTWIGLRPVESLRLRSFRMLIEGEGGRSVPAGGRGTPLEGPRPRLSLIRSAARPFPVDGRPVFRVYQGGRAAAGASAPGAKAT